MDVCIKLLLNSFSNLVGNDKVRIRLKKLIKMNFDKNVSIEPIDENRYLSYCNFAFYLNKYYDTFMDCFRELDNANELSDVQSKYYKIFKDNGILKVVVNMLSTLGSKIIKPIMKVANNTNSVNEYRKAMKVMFNKVETIKNSNFNDNVDMRLDINIDHEVFYSKKIQLKECLVNSIIGPFNKWDYYVKNNDLDEKEIDTGAIFVNREAERTISKVKSIISKNVFTTTLFIKSKLLLKYVDFKFNDLIPIHQQYFNKIGRIKYDKCNETRVC